MLKLKSEYIGKVFHCLDILEEDVARKLIAENKELFNKYFEEK